MTQARISYSPAWPRLSVMALWLGIPLLVVANGCNQHEEIRSYRVPKSETPAGGANGGEAVPKRMVVATLLAHDQAWFFKVEGTPAKLDPAMETITAFFKTIKPPADATAKPTWTLPEGWQEEPGAGMRLATVTMPDNALQMAITELIGVGDEQEYLLIIVNRWLGQISLPPIQADELDTRLAALDANGAKLWLFDATGKASGEGMTPPMVGGRMPPPPAATAPPKQSTPAADSSEPITFAIPEGWREVPPRMMVLRVLKVGSGEEEAEVAISAFPSTAPSIADPLSNANRWRGEVQLDDITAEELPESLEEVAIGDDTGKLVTALGETKGVVAAMVAKGDNVWFMKLHGTRENVERHREALVEWLKTVRIAEGNP